MFFIQNRYPDDFFCIFLSLFFLIGAPHCGNYDTETLFYHIYYRLYRLHLPYPCPTPRNMMQQPRAAQHAKRYAYHIIYASRYPHINIATAPPAKDGRRRIPARQSSCPTTSKAAHHPPIRRPTFRATNILNRRMAFADAYGTRAPKFLPLTPP